MNLKTHSRDLARVETLNKIMKIQITFFFVPHIKSKVEMLCKLNYNFSYAPMKNLLFYAIN